MQFNNWRFNEAATYVTTRKAVKLHPLRAPSGLLSVTTQGATQPQRTPTPREPSGSPPHDPPGNPREPAPQPHHPPANPNPVMPHDPPVPQQPPDVPQPRAGLGD